MATLNVRDYGAGRTNGADDGAIQGAFDAANDGDKIFFPENLFNNNCYVVDGTLRLNKSVALQAESSRVSLRKSSNAGTILEVNLSGSSNYIDIDHIGFISGANQVVISVTGSMLRVSSIANSVFAGTSATSLSLFCMGSDSNLNMKFNNSSFSSGTTPIILSSTTNFHNVSMNSCEIRDCSIAALRIDKIASSISSGNLSFGQNVFMNMGQGIILGSVTGSFLGNSFVGVTSNVVLSGTGRALSGTLLGL